jgi:hypothetical protein
MDSVLRILDWILNKQGYINKNKKGWFLFYFFRIKIDLKIYQLINLYNNKNE